MTTAALLGWARRGLAVAAARSGTLPIAAMALGLACPPVAGAMFGALPWIAAATVFCGLMATEGGAGARADWVAALRLLPVVALLAPAVAWAVAFHALGAGAEAAACVALVAAAPVSAVAVANIAAMGLPARPVALLLLLGTLTVPLVLPLIAWVAAADTAIRPEAVTERAAALVLVPAALALLLRRLPARARPALPARQSWKGIGAISLGVLALARMHGVGPQLVGDPAAAAWAALLAVVACGSGAVLALLSPSVAGWRGGILAGGCRTGALVYALIAPELPPEGHLFMAMTILPIYGLPPLVRATLRWRRRPANAACSVAVA